YVIKYEEGETYYEGIDLNDSEIEGMNQKTDKVVEANHMSKSLNGGLLVQLKIPDNTDTAGIKKAIEKASELVSSFRPIRKVHICSNCGLKEEKITDKCPTCNQHTFLP